MKAVNKLPWEVIWQHDGHVTDVVCTAMADGEEAIVPVEAVEHINGCDGCCGRIGQSASLSARIGSSVAAQRLARSAAAWRFPWASVLVALVAAGIGMMPALLQAPTWVAGASAAVVQGMPLCLRSAALVLRTFADRLQGTWLVLSLCSALVLAIAGLAVARTMGRQRSMQGGV
jgi:hypothetical protein